MRDTTYAMSVALQALVEALKDADRVMNKLCDNLVKATN